MTQRRWWHTEPGRCVIALVLAAAVIVLFAANALPARAHDFYSQACCSERDCKVALVGDVVWTPAGYRINSTNETIPENDPRIQYSPPGEPGYRLCIPYSPRKVRCLYIPDPES